MASSPLTMISLTEILPITFYLTPTNKFAGALLVYKFRGRGGGGVLLWG